ITYQNFVITSSYPFGVEVNGKSDLTFNRITTDGTMFYVHGASTAVALNYGKAVDVPANYGITVDNTSSITINNYVIASNYKAGICVSAGGGSATIYNSLIIGNSTSGLEYGTALSNGNLFVDYSLVTGNGVIPSYNWPTSGITDGGHNIKESLPATVSPKTNKALFALTTDDLSTSTWLTWSTALGALSTPVKFTIFTHLRDITSQQTQDLITLYNAGHDIGVHSRSHVDLTAPYPFTVSTSNANPTINVGTTAQTLTLTTTTNSPSRNVTVDWSTSD